MAEKREVNAEVEVGSSCLDLEETFRVKQLETGSDFLSIETIKDVNLYGLQDKIEYAGDGNSSSEKNLTGNEENDNCDSHVDLSGLMSKEKRSFFGNSSFECCPWKTFDRPGVLNLFKWKFFTEDNSNIPTEEVLDEVLKVQEVNKDKIQNPPADKVQTLWCSWVIKGPSKSYYFAGATGYYDRLFRTIGYMYGPFDLAAIPIGAYEPRFITKFEQVDPQEAVKIHQDVKSKQSIGMYWGTFMLTNEFFLEPPQEVERIMNAQGKDPSEFISLCLGETWCVGDTRERPPFMNYKQ